MFSTFHNVPRKRFGVLAVVLTGFVAATASGESTVVYQEIFPGDGLTGDPVVWLAAEGWNNHSGPNGTLAVEETLLSHGTTVPSSGPVNSFPTRTGGAQGYLMNRCGTTGEPAILWTDEYPDDLRFGDIAQISYDARHAGTDYTSYVAVRVDTGVSESWFISGGFDGPSAWTTLAVDFADATWEELQFEPDVALAMGGAATPDPDGNVTAFGIFQPSQTTNSNYRYDNYAVMAVPEPATFILFVTGALGLVACGWRKRGG